MTLRSVASHLHNLITALGLVLVSKKVIDLLRGITENTVLTKLKVRSFLIIEALLQLRMPLISKHGVR